MQKELKGPRWRLSLFNLFTSCCLLLALLTSEQIDAQKEFRLMRSSRKIFLLVTFGAILIRPCLRDRVNRLEVDAWPTLVFQPFALLTINDKYETITASKADQTIFAPMCLLLRPKVSCSSKDCSYSKRAVVVPCQFSTFVLRLHPVTHPTGDGETQIL